jgi:endonuclease-3
VGKSRHSTAAVKPGLSKRSQERPRALKVLHRLIEEFPRPKTALGHENPFQLLIATILSAQCTDERVNMVTPGLFKRYPTAKHLAQANPAELEQEIRSTGFYRMKAKSMIACSKALLERHGGDVPSHMDALVGLPGVGRKTANVVLGQAFGIASGVVVDTHVHRLSQRLGFTKADDPIKIEQDLMALFPQQDWINVGSVLILHGRRTCNARNPKCPACRVAGLCPSAEAFLKKLKR